MNKILRLIRSSFFPERCPYCGKTIECGKTACDICSRKLPEIYSKNFVKGGYPCCSPFFYKGIFKNAIKLFKFDGFEQNSEKLAIALARTINKEYADIKFDVVTCVPMHPKKERIRGYNQSKLLAKDVSKLISVKYEDLLLKKKNNIEQHKCLTAAERRENVKNVYKAIDNDKIKGKTILIIDDVLTTGYTLGECCKVLSENTNAKIYCATLCAKNNL